MPVDLNTAIHYGLCVKVVENIPTNDLTNRAGQTMVIGNVSYNVVATFYGNDLATDLNPGRVCLVVSFGLVLQDPNGAVVIAVRGTDGIWEWIHDAVFQKVVCPFLPGAGHTEDGFTAMYLSLRMTPDPNSARLAQSFAGLAFPRPVTTVTICGHSLGGALVTLLALDLAANTPCKTPSVYSYASPRTGDAQFVDTYNQVVPNTIRFSNRLDVVPGLPPAAFSYGHVNTMADLNAGMDVKLDALCRHHLTTYLYVMGKTANVPGLPLDSDCKFL
jgi:hypothetical protein